MVQQGFHFSVYSQGRPVIGRAAQGLFLLLAAIRARLQGSVEEGTSEKIGPFLFLALLHRKFHFQLKIEKEILKEERLRHKQKKESMKAFKTEALKPRGLKEKVARRKSKMNAGN